MSSVININAVRTSPVRCIYQCSKNLRCLLLRKARQRGRDLVRRSLSPPNKIEARFYLSWSSFPINRLMVAPSHLIIKSRLNFYLSWSSLVENTKMCELVSQLTHFDISAQPGTKLPFLSFLIGLKTPKCATCEMRT